MTEAEKAAVGTRNVQDSLNEQEKTAILAATPDTGLRAGLMREIDGKTPLEKHLATYAKRNTTDYFIHKDLSGFLTQELDFYIKNEMFDLDDLGTDKEVPIEQYLSRVRVMKAISLKIITFLAQIEDFQKKLFEKKKLVLSTNYCMTLDRVPTEFYPTIAKNANQIAEWGALYGIKGNAIDEKFLKAHPFLVLDTKFFPQEFKDQILATIDNLDDSTSGLLVKSENWQALSLLQERYREQVKCIYIDPPYNTGSDGFVYKDNYQHSSWLSLINDRITMGNICLKNTGLLSISMDDNEIKNLHSLLNEKLGQENFLIDFIWKKRSNPPNDQVVGSSHEFIVCYAKSKDDVDLFLLPRTAEIDATYLNPDADSRGPWKAGDLSAGNKGGRAAPSCIYEITNPVTGEKHLPPEGRRWVYNRVDMQKLLEEKRIWFSADNKGKPKLKRFLTDVRQGMTASSLCLEYGTSHSAANEMKDIFGYEYFETPKPTQLLRLITQLSIRDSETILDYFAGSGTTAHAVLNLNREDKGNRKYILVEMGDYFHTVLKPRIQKAIYSSEWKDGQPQNIDGISHIFKYLTLEQYEDTLNNIDFMEGGTVQKTLMDMDGYMLRYMLDFETRESPCRMNTTNLERPFEYTLRITKDSEMHNETVDLVETFNYLLGLKIKRVRTFAVNGTTYRVVHGETLSGQGTTVIWRTSAGLDLKADKTFIEEKVLTDPKLKAERVFINGDFHVEGALPIEPEFQRLMGA